jgi:integrase
VGPVALADHADRTATRQISALRWRHIDLERGVMWVHQASLKETSTKTNQRCKVALDEHTVGLLKAHREMWRERYAQLGVELSIDAFVFSPHPTAPRPPSRGPSARATGGSRCGWDSAALGCTR